MSCYFIVKTFIDKKKGAGLYEEYIHLVKPIVEQYGGEYIVRSNRISSIERKRLPDRIVIIKFRSRESLERCFRSKEYVEIMSKRAESVKSKTLIVEEDEYENW